MFGGGAVQLTVQEPHQRNMLPTGDKLKPDPGLTEAAVAEIQPLPGRGPAEGRLPGRGGNF